MQKVMHSPDSNTLNTSTDIEQNELDKKSILPLISTRRRTSGLTEKEIEVVNRFNESSALVSLIQFNRSVPEYTYYKPENKDSVFVHFRQAGQAVRLESNYLRVSEFVKAFPQGYFEYVDLTLEEVKFTKKHVIEIDDIGANLAYGVTTDFSTREYLCETESVKMVNLFSGFPCQPVAGNVDPFLVYVTKVLSSGNISAARFFIDWLADTVQNPGSMNPKAIILHSYGEGAGKNSIFEVCRRLIPLKFVTPLDPSMFVGIHNGNLEGKLIAFGDETFASSHIARDKLKSWIGNHMIPIRAMHRDSRMVKNSCRFMLSSNSDAMITIDKSNRRYVAFSVVEPNEDCTATLSRLYAWMDRPESMPALMDYLLKKKIKTVFHGPGVPIFFPDIVDAITQNSITFSDPVATWIRESLTTIFGTEMAARAGKRTYLELHNVYRNYCDRNNIRFIDISAFRSRLKVLPECVSSNISVWSAELKATMKGCELDFSSKSGAL